MEIGLQRLYEDDRDMRKNRDIRWCKKSCGLEYGYKKQKNIRYFENPIFAFGSALFNALYCIVKKISFIYGCRHDQLNHITTLYIIMLIVLSLCFWINLVYIKAFDTTNWYQSLAHTTYKNSLLLLGWGGINIALMTFVINYFN